jgi:hypothetical protein
MLSGISEGEWELIREQVKHSHRISLFRQRRSVRIIKEHALPFCTDQTGL